jgi:hypothetical protein
LELGLSITCIPDCFITGQGRPARPIRNAQHLKRWVSIPSSCSRVKGSLSCQPSSWSHSRWQIS